MTELTAEERVKMRQRIGDRWIHLSMVGTEEHSVALHPIPMARVLQNEASSNEGFILPLPCINTDMALA